MSKRSKGQKGRKKSKRGVPRGPLGVRHDYRGSPKTLLRSEEDADAHDQIYRNSNVKRFQERIGEFVFDPDRWAAAWADATDKANFQMKKVRGLRKLAQIGTLQAILSCKYYLPDGQVLHLNKKVMEKASHSTKMYNHDDIKQMEAELKDEEIRYDTQVMVVDGDCLETTAWLANQNLKPVVLNMASANNPGGGYTSAAGAQEENLHRRTSLVHCLPDPYKVDSERSWSYPIPDYGGVYTPKALYFRGSEVNCYKFLDKPMIISVVSVAAYPHPPTQPDGTGELRLSGKFAEMTKKKMRAMLSIALNHGHDTVVLSAFGCGAYRNPPKHIAELFKEVINRHFPRLFKCIVFSIIDDHNAHRSHNPEGNLVVFGRVFKTEVIRDISSHPDLDSDDEMDENSGLPDGVEIEKAEDDEGKDT